MGEVQGLGNVEGVKGKDWEGGQEEGICEVVCVGGEKRMVALQESWACLRRACLRSGVGVAEEGEQRACRGGEDMVWMCHC